MMKRESLTRGEFFTRLQVIRKLEPLVDYSYKISEEKILRERLDDSPHGDFWHVSFHASQFPGNNPMACPRESLYRMMDFPPSVPIPRHLRQTGDAGKAIEVSLVNAFANAGLLLSSADPYAQTGFVLPEFWLTGSVDAVIQPPGTRKPLPVEIKNRSQKALEEMQVGRGPWPEHVSQIKVQIAMLRHTQRQGLWLPVDEYQLTDHGLIYYVSRNDPMTTAEFRVDHDENFFVAGTEKLKRWRAYFVEDHLPELDPGKRSSNFGHPNGWRWSYQPCQWCSFKKTCQLDFREGTTTLSESIGVERAKDIRPDYDAELARLRVLARWQEKKTKEQPEAA
jgi:hypothetical protein